MTEFIFEVDISIGKPKRPRLIQAFNRIMALNEVDLLGAKTEVFMDALVATGAITVQRKTEILKP